MKIQRKLKTVLAQWHRPVTPALERQQHHKFKPSLGSLAIQQDPITKIRNKSGMAHYESPGFNLLLKAKA